MDRPVVRLAVLGSGFGAAVALPVFAAMPGVEVAAVVARRADKAAEVARRHGVARFAAGFASLPDLDVDAVYIALPPDVSGQAIRLAQECHLHIFAEKPLTADSTELSAIARWPARRVQMVNYGFPELPAFQHLRWLLHHQAYGRVRLVNVRWLVQSYAEQHRLRNWKRDRRRGGGVLPLLGSHFFHYMEWLFGPVGALRAIPHPASESEDPTEGDTGEFIPADPGVSVWLEMADGFLATATLSNAAPFASCHEIEVICDRATIRLTNPGSDYMKEFHCAISSAGTTSIRRFELKGNTVDSRAVAFRLLAERFIAVVTGQSAGPTGPRFADDVRTHLLLQTTALSLAIGNRQLVTASVSTTVDGANRINPSRLNEATSSRTSI
jgi:predicted dehydrogenase